MGKTRVRSEKIPEAKGEKGNNNDRGNKIAGHLVGEFLDRCSRALCLGDHVDNLGKHGVAADFLGPHGQCAGRVDCGPYYLVALLFFDRHGFTCDHGFIDQARAAQNHTIDRHLLSWTNPEGITHLNLIQGNIYFFPIVRYFSCVFRRKPQECFNGCSGLSPCSEFQHLPQKNQCDDHRSRFKIDTHRAIGSAQGCRKNVREKKSNNAVDIRNRNTKPYQGEHVEASIDHGLHGSDIKGPASPQDHWSCHEKLQPTQSSCRSYPFNERSPRQHIAHSNDNQRHCQNGAKDEALVHVFVFGIVLLLSYGFRFERHAAFRTGTGMILYHFRMHGAGIFDPFGTGWVWDHGFKRHAALWTGTGVILYYFRMHRTGVLLVLWPVSRWGHFFMLSC